MPHFKKKVEKRCLFYILLIINQMNFKMPHFASQNAPKMPRKWPHGICMQKVRRDRILLLVL